MASVKAELELQCVSAARDRHCVSEAGSPPACTDLAALADALKVISQDEAGHAALAFRAVRWATRADEEARKRVEHAVSARVEHAVSARVEHAVSARSRSGTKGALSLAEAVDRDVVAWWNTGSLASEVAGEGVFARAIRVVGDRVMDKGASEVVGLL